MGITTECNSIYYLNKTESEGQRTENLQVNLEKKSKVTEYLDYIYSYPPKIKIKAVIKLILLLKIFIYH